MNEEIYEQAAQWLADQDSDEMDWHAFTAWLETDPMHRKAFDTLALLDDGITAQRAAIARVDRRSQQAPRRWGWFAAGGGAVTAAIALAVALPRTAPDTVWQSGRSVRAVQLADGTRAVLAPHSRLVANHANQAQLALAGDAFFDVPHRADRTLSIAAGGYRISDIGTRFAVSASPFGTRVAVEAGSLAISSGTLIEPVQLTAGRALLARNGRVTLGSAASGAIASWRRGVLIYDAMPLTLVAADIARYAGTQTTVAPLIADRRFTGALTIGDGTTLANSVAAISGVAIRRDGDRVRMEPRR